MAFELCIRFLAQLLEKLFLHTLRLIHIDQPYQLTKEDNQPVGKHPKVCNLMTGLFSRNPPKPRYVLIWDIKQVLTFIRGMPNNTELSDRNINFKLVVLS